MSSSGELSNVSACSRRPDKGWSSNRESVRESHCSCGPNPVDNEEKMAEPDETMAGALPKMDFESSEAIKNLASDVKAVMVEREEGDCGGADDNDDDDDEKSMSSCYNPYDKSSRKGSSHTPESEIIDPMLTSPMLTSSTRQQSRLSTRTTTTTATQSTTSSLSPLHLPTFKPAVGCTDSSEFVRNCFATRLRVGMTVSMYLCSSSRWWYSKRKKKESQQPRRLRALLQFQANDCQFLTWQLDDEAAAVAAAATDCAPRDKKLFRARQKRPQVHRLDLGQCSEVRHAWTRDPQNPTYTGTANLRQSCKVSNIIRSFSLIFPQNQTVDMTAETLDQCKILLAGFTAVCYHIHVSKGANKQQQPDEGVFKVLTSTPEQESQTL